LTDRCRLKVTDPSLVLLELIVREQSASVKIGQGFELPDRIDDEIRPLRHELPGARRRTHE